MQQLYDWTQSHAGPLSCEVQAWPAGKKETDKRKHTLLLNRQTGSLILIRDQVTEHPPLQDLRPSRAGKIQLPSLMQAAANKGAKPLEYWYELKYGSCSLTWGVQPQIIGQE